MLVMLSGTCYASMLKYRLYLLNITASRISKGPSIPNCVCLQVENILLKAAFFLHEECYSHLKETFDNKDLTLYIWN